MERSAGIQGAAQGGRIGYQTGEQVLPMPRPTDEDPRLGFFKRMGALPEQTLLRQPQSMNAMRGQMGGQGIMGQTPDPFGGLLGGQEGDIGMGGQPLVEYEHEGAEQPPSWVDRLQTGTYDGSLPHTPDINMEMIIDFLKKQTDNNSDIVIVNISKSIKDIEIMKANNTYYRQKISKILRNIDKLYPVCFIILKYLNSPCHYCNINTNTSIFLLSEHNTENIKQLCHVCFCKLYIKKYY